MQALTQPPVRPGLEYWAALRPSEPAIVDGLDVLSWAEWNRRADALADSLLRLGVSEGDVIAIRMNTRWEWLVAASAVGKIGARILGVNWRLRPDELGYILSDSAAVAMIFDDAEADAIVDASKKAGVRVNISVTAQSVLAHAFADLIADRSPRQHVPTESARVILYTSGTTGRPKGVQTMTPPNEKAREQFFAYAQSVHARTPRGPSDVLLLTMPMHHGAGLALYRGALFAGTRIIVLRRFDPAKALELIEQHRVTFWSVVPTMIYRVFALNRKFLDGADVSSIRALSIGGAPVNRDLKQQIVEYFGDGVLHEGYGSTETSMITHFGPADPAGKMGSSGRPFEHVEISIRSSDGELLPVGATGEIWAKTPVTIRQYINEPPLGPDTLDAEGFFRTGDVGHLDSDGFLFITDRAKDLIISGGVNIYPAEIESVLRQHPSVQDVAVIGAPDAEFGEKVWAFCELKPGTSASPEEIIDASKQHLASYKLPKSLTIVDELPRNSMGKTMKAALRAPLWENHARNI